MKLGALFPDVTADLADLTCEALTADSRKASPDTVFIAVPGNKADGRTYIADAVSRGVRVVVAEGPRPTDLPASVSYHAVRDARFVLAKAAARLYPDTPAHIVAVTGTSGKSSVAEFVRQIFASLGHEAASLGTLGITRAGHTSYGQLTTPDPVSLHHILSDLAHEGVTHLSMEASSMTTPMCSFASRAARRESCMLPRFPWARRTTSTSASTARPVVWSGTSANRTPFC